MIVLFRNIIGSNTTLKHGAWLCIASGLGLSLLGLYAIDLGAHDPPSGPLPVTIEGVVLKQILFLCAGLMAATLAALPHYKIVRSLAWPSMIVVLGLLAFLLIPFVPTSIVRPRNGARAWIDLGPVDLQPAELAKIAFVLVAAHTLRYRQTHRKFLGLVLYGLLAGVPMGLILLQPDMGTVLLFVPVLFAMLFVSGAKTKHLAIVVVCAMLAAPAAYPLLKPHQKKRIEGLLLIMKDPRRGANDINYQMVTAKTLAGSGEVLGQSDGRARSLIRFNRLPERHNDMIFPIIVCRFGLLGGVLVGALYGVWFLGAYLTAAFSKDPFARLLVVGFMTFIAGQAFVNIAMTIGILPVIGVSLPFVSYGGSSMLSSWLMTGLVVSVAMRRQATFAKPAFEYDPIPYDPDDPHLPQKIMPQVGSESGRTAADAASRPFPSARVIARRVPRTSNSRKARSA